MTTAGSVLQRHIERWVDELRLTTLDWVESHGRLPPRVLAIYLESLRVLFAHSQQNLAFAAEVSRRRGLAAFYEYFVEKAAEERGHDAWAARDLSQLPELARHQVTPSRAIFELIQLQSELIEHHPACFFAYVLWAEYMTVLTGDQWLAVLSACGYERTRVSAVANHVAADREHARHGFAQLERLWTGEPPLDELLDAVTRAGDTFHRFCQDLIAEVKRAA